ncbi:phosphate signaling complex protein PhoU [Desulfitibacter alkalitolerans]|uniref:phosphate signaling complex protein PhoU n=1 Tax=Desulfitibacter alkalitolerans TaxID=264641 RepID=UPI0004871829|nr:phosphate signaling complex protein PhoU [Desulfitibacter alkalitolerans]
MIRANFQQSLEELQKEICKMGSLVEEMITEAIKSLVKQDLDLADAVLQKDKIVNKLDLEIEDRCMKLIATQQPMGKDLRLIGITFNVIKDLERMADHACDIAKTVKRIGTEPLIKPLIDIPRMAEFAKRMVKKSLDSYVAQDVELAEEISQDDDQVDKLHNQIFRELLVIMMENPKTITQATYLLFISSSLERIGDYATNICESVIFLVTGERKDLNP